MTVKLEAAPFVRRSKARGLVLACAIIAAWPSALWANDRSADAARKAPPVDMRHVERITVRVWGTPDRSADLGGQYSIDHDFSLSYPGLGRIEVGKMTSAELEKVLARRLGALTRTDVTVSVNVDVFRPFFIMGHVAEPGAIAWRPGLKVLQALTLARGVARSLDTRDPASGLDRVVAHRQSQTRLTFALAQLARYKAERDGVDMVSVNKRIATLISRVPESGRGALTELVNRQNDMLAEQRHVMQTQLVGLRREREAGLRELAAAETQEKAIRTQLELTRDLLSDIEDLWKRKLVSKTRYLNQRSELLTAEVRYAEANSLVERIRARLSTIDQQIVMLPQERRLTLNERIDELEREVAQLEYTSYRDDPSNVTNFSYHITRETDEGVQSIAATVFTEIFPGDVVIVSDPQSVFGATTLSGELPATSELPIRDDGSEGSSAKPIIEGSLGSPHRTVSAAGGVRSSY